MGKVSAASTTTAGPRPAPHITSLLSRTEDPVEVNEEEMRMGEAVDDELTSPLDPVRISKGMGWHDSEGARSGDGGRTEFTDKVGRLSCCCCCCCCCCCR